MPLFNKSRTAQIAILTCEIVFTTFTIIPFFVFGTMSAVLWFFYGIIGLFYGGVNSKVQQKHVNGYKYSSKVL